MFRKLKKTIKSTSPTTIKRGVTLSFSNMVRNLLSTSSTLLVMTLILLILNITLLLNNVVANQLANLQAKVDVIVYLKDDSDLLKVKELEDKLKAMPTVDSVKYTSKDEALKKFLKNYPESDNPFEKYVLQNPLPADLTIVTKRAEDQQIVLDFLRQGQYSDLLASVSQSDIVNQQITRNVIIFTRSVENFLFLLILTFVISSILIIINAIHFTIYTRKEEIGIMQLVGARPYFIKFPFLVEGMIYGGLATTISIGLLVAIAYYLNSPQFTILDINSYLKPSYIASEIAIGTLFGLFSAWIATSLYFTKKGTLRK